MMKIKEISFIQKGRDEYNDNLDVGVEFEDSCYYTIIKNKLPWYEVKSKIDLTN